MEECRASLKERYLVIGASSDVALAWLENLGERCRREKKENVTVVAHYHSHDDALSSIAECYPEIRLLLVSADLTKEEGTQIILQFLFNEDVIPEAVLYFPAETFRYMRLKEFDRERLDGAVCVGAAGFLSLMKELLPKMKRLEDARVLVMLTAYVKEELPPKFMVDYVTGKYALLGAMKAVAAEFGSDTLKINAVSPEMMDTKFLKELDPRIKEMSALNAPEKRLLTPEDLVCVIDHMISSEYKENGRNEGIFSPSEAREFFTGQRGRADE